MSHFQRICLVHYHEIGLKGHNRSMFEMRLVRNLEAILADFPLVLIQRISGRLCVFIKEGTSYELACQIEQAICNVPGVARVSCGYRCEREMDQINQAAVDALNDVGDFYTFKVAARRNHTDFPINSMELNRLVGAHLCEHFPDKKVKMVDPDAKVCVEIIQGSAYVYACSIRGIGGLPVGTSGKIVSLLSSGIDSPVATWKMARRGAELIGVHFSGRPQTSPESEYLVDDIAHVLERTGCIARVYVVPLGDYQREISLEAPPSLRVILYRRLMFRVACELAKREGAKAIATGESLGQVASQTIDNINATNAVVDIPVFRPLIGSDKQEIIAEAQRLGTYGISSKDAPDCCTLFMPRNPETHADLEKVEKAEAQFPIDEWVAELVEAAEVHDYKCPSFKPKKPKKSEARTEQTE